MSDPTLPPPVPAPARKGRGCMFYGCMTLVLLLLFAAVLAGVGVYYVRKNIGAYTEAVPTVLPKVTMSDEEFQKLLKRVTAFHDAVEKGTETEPLILNEREINALIQKSEKAKDLAGRLYVTLKGDEIGGQVSVPLTELNWLIANRYLNGQATFKISLESGVLNIIALDVKVKGNSLPESVMSTLRTKNLAPDATKSPETAAEIAKLESIQVQDSTLVVKAKAAP